MGQPTAEWLRSRYGAAITWLPFDLHPEYPPEGIPRAELVARYGPGMQERVAGMFERAGLVYAPNAEVVPNSQLALRVTELARDRELHEPVHNRLMEGYWSEGRNLSDPEVLRELAAEAGLDDIAPALRQGRFSERIAASTAQAQSFGITGIPAFLLDGRLLVLGAQPPEIFERAFVQLSEA